MLHFWVIVAIIFFPAQDQDRNSHISFDKMTKTISIISSNNRGVDLLEAGRLKDALLEFKQGLETATMSFRRRYHTKSFFAFPDSVEWSSNLSRQETPPLTSPFVYARAMRICGGDIVSKVTLGALTYNFALTSHLRFVEIGEKGREMKYSTMKIYKRAYVLLHELPLCLAVLNNMRQIHLSLNHEQDSSDCRDQIAKLLGMFQQYFALENKELFEEVLMNLVAQKEVIVTPAA